MSNTNPLDLHPMTNQIPIEEALKLVQFNQGPNGSWHVENVKGNVKGNVYGDVYGDVCGDVYGDVKGNVWGDVCGDVCGNVGGAVLGNVCGNVGGTINGRQWRSIKTPREKLKRLIEEGADKGTLLAAVNQLEDSDG